VLTSRVLRGKKNKVEKFRDYFDYQEGISKVPPHRFTRSILEGKRIKILKTKRLFENEKKIHPDRISISLISIKNVLNTTELGSQRNIFLQRRYLKHWLGKIS